MRRLLGLLIFILAAGIVADIALSRPAKKTFRTQAALSTKAKPDAGCSSEGSTGVLDSTSCKVDRP